MPAPLDNPLVLALVIVGVLVMIFAMRKARASQRQLEETRAKKAKMLRDAKAKAAQNSTPSSE